MEISPEERNRTLLEIKLEEGISKRIELCEKYLKDNPSDNEVLVYTGFLYWECFFRGSNSLFNKGHNHLIKVLNDPEYGPLVKDDFVKGQFVDLGNKSIEYKIETCEKFILPYFSDKIVFSWLSSLYAQKKEWGKASEYLLKYIENGGDVHEYQAVILFEHGQEIKSKEELTAFQKKISETQGVDSYWILNAAAHLFEMESKEDISSEEISYALADFSIPYGKLCQLLIHESSDEKKGKCQREKILLEKILLTYYKKGFTRTKQLKQDKLNQFEALVETYDDIEGRLLLGDYHFEKQEWDGAKNHYQSLYKQLVQKKEPADFLNDILFNRGRMAGLLFSYLKIPSDISEESYATNILNRVKGYNDETLCRFIINLYKARKDKIVLDQPKKRIALFGFDPIKLWWDDGKTKMEGEFSENNCLLSYLRAEYTLIHNGNQSNK